MVETRHEFRALLGVYAPIAVGVFLIVVATLGFVVVRFRHRPGRVVSKRSTAPRLELLYVLVLAGIATFLVVITFRTESRVDALAASPALRIAATGSDWRWSFYYPAQGIDEVGRGQGPTELYVPADRTIEFDLTSLDVIHAFYIPYEDYQRAAIPRIVNRFDLVFPKPGVQTSGYCNEYCGIGHTAMRFEIHVLTPTAFAAWVSRQPRARTAR
ncbi:MAG TPA: cytochrome c oxidase subunit II [Solirubrobacteraceae bacterium]|nr:cytochrome c oxidase subunit II [Solirubrobacteraceae bacterium]